MDKAYILQACFLVSHKKELPLAYFYKVFNFKNLSKMKRKKEALYVSSIVIGIIAHFACIIFGFTSMGIVKFILIPMIAGFLSDIFIMVLTSSIAFLSFRKGHDPDNILMPSVTSISDVFSILALFLTVKVFMLFS
ncbi:hypothetical protein B6U82_01045 [Candidatus Pacearchaeota archaeon ex4484_31]|nr:MAG: hypothetical protein B6U82_01045 [Candidatus Pacearchaeota archaeon ex4484_31]